MFNKKLLTLCLATLSLAGCVLPGNDQAYNISGLSPVHQILFQDAMDWHNQQSGSNFTSDPQGVSQAVYGTPSESTANGQWAPRPAIAANGEPFARVTFCIEDASCPADFPKWSITSFCGVSKHELWHHLNGLEHSTDPYSIGFTATLDCALDSIPWDSLFAAIPWDELGPLLSDRELIYVSWVSWIYLNSIPSNMYTCS